MLTRFCDMWKSDRDKSPSVIQTNRGRRIRKPEPILLPDDIPILLTPHLLNELVLIVMEYIPFFVNQLIIVQEHGRFWYDAQILKVNDDTNTLKVKYLRRERDARKEQQEKNDRNDLDEISQSCPFIRRDQKNCSLRPPEYEYLMQQNIRVKGWPDEGVVLDIIAARGEIMFKVKVRAQEGVVWTEWILLSSGKLKLTNEPEPAPERAWHSIRYDDDEEF